MFDFVTVPCNLQPFKECLREFHFPPSPPEWHSGSEHVPRLVTSSAWGLTSPRSMYYNVIHEVGQLMYIDYPLVWTQAVVDKIWQKHKVAPEEVDEAVFDDSLLCLKGTASSYCGYGQAVSGRYLFVVLSKRGRRARYRVITARDMQDKEKRYYRKSRR